MAPLYKLRCTLKGHAGDVRSVVAASDLHAFSASRDKTVRAWYLSNASSDACEGEVYSGHEGYISALAVIRSHDKSGQDETQFLTGSHDKSIRLFTSIHRVPKATMTGHTDSVCALTVVDIESKHLIVSGSWDSTVRLWRDNNCILTIKGHSSAVWCVLAIYDSNQSGLRVVSGSADHTIRVWQINDLDTESPSHRLIDTLTGHTDCVRSLCQLNATHIFSASNDASIRIWSLSSSGVCVGEFYGHANYVYALALTSDKQLLASTSEDRSCRLWEVPDSDALGPGKQFSCLQTLRMPFQTPWCCAFTPNNDLLVGGSDQTIRLFSACEARQASDAVQEEFRKELANSKLPIAGELDGKTLPGPEALYQPGTNEGQVVVVKDGTRTVCYQWSSHDSTWVEVGDVVGSQTNSKMYEGKEYDFVFDVDIGPGIPMIKLPYNITEDPWFAAQRFINQHELPQDFLTQVANFIIQGVGPQNIAAATSNTLSDPFTGDSRYRPSNEPQSDTGSLLDSTVPVNQSLLPSTELLQLKDISLAALVNKLTAFNDQLEHQQRLDANELKLVENFAFDLPESDAELLTKLLLRRLTSWPVDKIFPLLDILRCLVLRPTCFHLIFDSIHWTALWSLSGFCPSPTNDPLPAANSLLTVRLLANALTACWHALADDATLNYDLVNTCLSASISVMTAVTGDQFVVKGKRPHQLAIGALIHNLAVFASKANHFKSSDVAGKLPKLLFIPALTLRAGLHLLSMGPPLGLAGATLFQPEAIVNLGLSVGTSLLTVKPRNVDGDDTIAIKKERRQLLESAAPGKAGEEVEIKTGDASRNILVYWRSLQTCHANARSIFATILTLVE